jgi:hypothetical protein
VTQLLIAFALGGIVAVVGLLVYVFIEWGRIVNDIDDIDD